MGRSRVRKGTLCQDSKGGFPVGKAAFFWKNREREDGKNLWKARKTWKNQQNAATLFPKKVV